MFSCHGNQAYLKVQIWYNFLKFPWRVSGDLRILWTSLSKSENKKTLSESDISALFYLWHSVSLNLWVVPTSSKEEFSRINERHSSIRSAIQSFNKHWSNVKALYQALSRVQDFKTEKVHWAQTHATNLYKEIKNNYKKVIMIGLQLMLETTWWKVRALLLECQVCSLRKFPASDSESLWILKKLSNGYSVQRKLVREQFTFSSLWWQYKICSIKISKELPVQQSQEQGKNTR